MPRKRTASHIEHVHKKEQKPGIERFLPALAVIILLFAAYGAYASMSANKALDKRLALAAEAARPGEINLVTISYPGCTSCYDISTPISQIKSSDVNVTGERELSYDSSEAQALIKRYGITRLPTVIVTGEINKSSRFMSSFQQFGEQVGDALIVNKQAPPYYSVEENRVVGLVTFVELEDQDCVHCTSLEPIVNSLKQAGLVPKTNMVIDVSSSHGQDLVKKYDLKKVPALILDKEAAYYTGFESSWIQLGEKAGDSYIMKDVTPPFMNLSSGKEEGVVHATFITDSSCEKCYDPQIHKQILARFGINIASEDTYDMGSPEGKAIIDKYNLTQVPTVILSDGASQYATFVSVWNQVGTVEDDGSYVFRTLDAIGKVVYRNLATNETVNEQ